MIAEETYDKLNNAIKQSGAKILSEIVKNKVLISCSCGNEQLINVHSFIRGGGYCGKCKYKRISNKLSINIEDIEKIFKENNCILLDKEYNSKNKNLNFICKCGNISRKGLYSFIKNPMCNKCSKEKVYNNIKFKKIQELYKIAKNNKCNIININENGNENFNKFIVEFKCNCGNISKKLVGSFIKNTKCNECSKQSSIDKRSISYNYIYNFVKENNCLLITKENEYNSSSGKIKVKCQCGDIYKTTFMYFKFENKRQCNKCGRSKISGENSHLWRGGASSDNTIIRGSKEYRKWKLDVFKKDNFTCQCCGDNSGGNLEAHHLENFSDYENLRYDIDNGITLCKDCHNPNIYGSFHNTYGTRFNTPDQLYEYIDWYKEDVESLINNKGCIDEF